MTDAASSRGPSRSFASRQLSQTDRYASRPLAAVVVVAVTGAWLIVSIAAGFPARWEVVFQTVAAALTLIMVFVVQHSQVRHQRASQRKLDEILLALPGADHALLTLEHASDDELHAAGHQHLSARQSVVDGEAGLKYEAGSDPDGS
jgi:low affinity Fe/Cu permease